MEIQQGTVEEGGGISIGGIVTGGTTGSVLFVGPGSALAQDNANLFWDDTNNRFGIGTASPAHKLDVAGAISAIGASSVSYWMGDGTAIRGLAASNGNIYVDASQDLTGTVFIRGSAVSLSGTVSLGSVSTGGNILANGGDVLVGVSGGIGSPGLRVFKTGGADWRIEQGRDFTDSLHFANCTTGCGPAMSLTSTNRLGIGTSTPDVKLQVEGQIKTEVVAVGSLPLASTAGIGARSFVNNALTPVFGAAVVGGGAVAVPVFSDGTNWNVG